MPAEDPGGEGEPHHSGDYPQGESEGGEAAFDRNQAIGVTETRTARYSLDNGVLRASYVSTCASYSGRSWAHTPRRSLR